MPRHSRHDMSVCERALRRDLYSLAHVSKPCARLIVCALAALEEHACHIGARAGYVPVEQTKTIFESLYGADLVLGSRKVSVDDAKRG
jgi:hypothetical protein